MIAQLHTGKDHEEWKFPAVRGLPEARKGVRDVLGREEDVSRGPACRLRAEGREEAGGKRGGEGVGDLEGVDTGPGQDVGVYLMTTGNHKGV